MLAFTDEELIEALREARAASSSSFVSMADYTTWRERQTGRTLPTVNQITGRFSGWTNAEAFAGTSPVEPREIPDTREMLPDARSQGVRIGDYLPFDLEQQRWLIAIGLVLGAWRNGPFEDVHAGSGLSAIDDGEMMRSNAALVRAVHAELDGPDTLHGSLLAIRRLLSDPKRKLPDGRTVREVCGPLYKQVVRHANNSIAASAYDLIGHNPEVVWQWLVARGALGGGSWHGTPWWPGLVDGFLAGLDDPDRQEHAAKLSFRPEITDRDELRTALLAGPDTLPPRHRLLVRMPGHRLRPPCRLARPRHAASTHDGGYGPARAAGTTATPSRRR